MERLQQPPFMYWLYTGLTCSTHLFNQHGFLHSKSVNQQKPRKISRWGFFLANSFDLCYILGIKVTNDQGYLLTYRQAFDRTKNLIIHLCFYIPFIYHVCLFSYFKKCNHDEFCPWENESIETIVDEKSYRYVVYGFIYLGILALSLFIANPLSLNSKAILFLPSLNTHVYLR